MTRYRYEKVTFVSDKEKAEAFIEGGLLFLTHGEIKSDMERDAIPVTRLDELLCGNAIYRRIEVTKRDWWEDVCDFIDKATDESGIAEPFKIGSLNVNAKMTRDQWCDFARILLEQEEN
ncbi:MAG: hypothetical protein GY782_03560 [Gammaproteobacteria bacterium]|nr:hypothetical protein [Gammaproteobacteria bacterium]